MRDVPEGGRFIKAEVKNKGLYQCGERIYLTIISDLEMAFFAWMVFSAIRETKEVYRGLGLKCVVHRVTAIV